MTHFHISRVHLVGLTSGTAASVSPLTRRKACLCSAFQQCYSQAFTDSQRFLFKFSVTGASLPLQFDRVRISHLSVRVRGTLKDRSLRG